MASSFAPSSRGQRRIDRLRRQLARDAIVRALHLVGRVASRDDAEHLEVVALLDQRVARQQRRAPIGHADGRCRRSSVGMSSNSRSPSGAVRVRGADASASRQVGLEQLVDAGAQLGEQRVRVARRMRDRRRPCGALAAARALSGFRTGGPAQVRPAPGRPGALRELLAGGRSPRSRPVGRRAVARRCCRPCRTRSAPRAPVRAARRATTGRMKNPSARPAMRGSSALSPTRKIGTRPRGTDRTLASACAGSGWTICGAMTISAGRLAVIQPDRLSPGSTATASKPADTAALRSRSASYGPAMMSSFIRWARIYQTPGVSGTTALAISRQSAATACCADRRRRRSGDRRSRATRRPRAARAAARDRGAITRRQPDLPAHAPAQHRQRRLGRAAHGDARRPARAGRLGGGRRGGAGLGAVAGVDAQRDHARERRVAGLLARHQLVVREAFVVVRRGGDDRRVVGRVGLDDDAPRAIAAPGPPRHLLDAAGRSARRRGSRAGSSSDRACSTPTSVTPGKSWPFVTICVPTRTSISPACMRARIASRPLPASARSPAVSRSRRATRASGKRSRTIASTCSVPMPIRSRRVDAHDGQRSGTCCRRPQ